MQLDVPISGPAAGAAVNPRVAAVVARLFAPVDVASLVFFRVAFGVVSFLHVWNQVQTDVRATYIVADFQFTFYGFGWVKPLPEDLMYLLFFAMAGSALLIAVGLFYRAAAVFFFLSHTYVLLIDQAAYWNHYYLITLFAFLMIFVPAHRSLSLDVARGAVRQSDEAPAWSLWILRAQIGIAYFFAGVAKVNSDWLHGAPMDKYLTGHQDFPILGRFFDEQLAAYAASYAGLLFDLAIVPLLLWRVTRVPALVLAFGFHLFNSLVFNIEVFPWFAIVATLLFLQPSWPRLGGQWLPLSPRQEQPPPGEPRPLSLSTTQKVAGGVLAAYFIVQVLLPLRHYAIPGNVDWTNEGMYFGWRMLITQKTGSVRYIIKDKDTSKASTPNLADYLRPSQVAHLYERPDMIIQFAHYLAKKYREQGQDVQVFAATRLCLNGRLAQSVVDSSVDLAAESRPLFHASWVTDLKQPLPSMKERLTHYGICN